MIAANLGPSLNILLVEDSPSDVRLTQEAMLESESRSTLRVVGDGEEAIKFLNNEGPYETEPRPDLILLDLNLPKLDGKDVLRQIKKTSELKSIPVVVLSTSTAKEDVCECYALHANCYVSKPRLFDDFVATIKEIEAFWLSRVSLPMHGIT
jgi:two-component system, chemotaxis family, response regulator Rcp1